MPETSVHKNRPLLPGETRNQGFAENRLMRRQPVIPASRIIKIRRSFRSLITMRADTRHYVGTLGFGEYVWHG